MAGALKARTSVGPDVWTVIGYGGLDLAAADARYVSKAGDIMTGRLTIAQSTTVPMRLLSGSAGSASIYGCDATDTTNNGRLTFLDSGGVALTTERTDEPIKFMVNNVDKLTVGATALTAGVPVVLPADPTTALQAATKQYVDIQAINAQTGTSYTFVLADASKMVTFSNAAAISVTVPPNSSVAYPIGTRIDLAQIAAGKVTVLQGSGVTVSATPTRALRTQYSHATLLKTGTDIWLMSGDMA